MCSDQHFLYEGISTLIINDIEMTHLDYDNLEHENRGDARCGTKWVLVRRCLHVLIKQGQIRELNGRPVQIQIHFGTHPIRPIECRGVEIPNRKWEFWHVTYHYSGLY